MALALAGVCSATEITPLPEKVPCAVADKQDFQIPDRVQLTGWLGTRITANETNRLVKIDTERLLEGYRKRPGRQSWDGEHVGKWLHAATLAWVNTGDPALRTKLDATAAELCKCQLPDGYLGTYLDKDRWTEWDVWAHKYNLIGLITYIRYTGNTAPLATCTRMANLLCKTFGDGPGQRDIITAGHHAGMAPTSVLEPMVLLYRFTGEKRYLDFCHYILRAWEQPNGPHIVSRLLKIKCVDKVGNAKAYEMLSCLVGALELYRTTGDKRILQACRYYAWQDIVDHRLYLTGAASYREHFHDDFDLPNVNNVGETCVTVTWLQFNAQLLRLTGEAKFAEQLERVVYNQLLGAQKPDGSAWGYYVQMEGKKPYSSTLDGHCCLSSGPRGIALLPTFASTTDADGIVVNLYAASTAQVKLRDGTPVTVRIETDFPATSRIRIYIEPSAPKFFSVKLRIPRWGWYGSSHTSIPVEPIGMPDGYERYYGEWQSGSMIELNREGDQELRPCIVVGDHLNQGKVALTYGPLVLAADEALIAANGQSLNTITIAKPDLAALAFTPAAAPAEFKTWPGAQVYRINAVTLREGKPVSIPLVPFADAGMTGARYKVWLPLAGAPSANVLLDGTESRSRQGNQTGSSRSRQGNQNGSINDDDPGNCAVTFDGKPAKEDWFAITLDAPANIRRFVFMHGKNFHDGGWFAGKPKVQIQREKNGAWETIGELADFPADAKKLKAGQAFTLKLPEPAKAFAVRVIGTPASGDNPKQAFASCAELQAFSD
ncbi:MAG: glycoside hydrolase family 127 protein [Kiritimatiellaeota bacterium]|nr:glycoside hydrolase family 127 protein [Kiritimatiellota bacterium]